MGFVLRILIVGGDASRWKTEDNCLPKFIHPHGRDAAPAEVEAAVTQLPGT